MFDPVQAKMRDDVFKQTFIVWAGLMASMVFYLIIIYLLQSRIEPRAATDQFMTLRNILFSVAAFQFLAAFVIRRALLKNSPMPGQAIPKHLGRYRIAVLVSSALAEAIAVYGLVLFILYQDQQNFLILIAIASFGLIMHRPKRTEFDAWLSGMAAQ